MNHSGANYIIKVGGVEDSDGEVSLSVGINVITIEVTAEDGNTTQTYTVTVTRAENTPATGKPVITGTAEVGETLTVDVSSIADEDGIARWPGSVAATWEFQYGANCGGLHSHLGIYYIVEDSSHPLYDGRGGEAQKTLEVPWRAAGKAIQVRVSFYDEGGDRESLYSEYNGSCPRPDQEPEASGRIRWVGRGNT